MNPKTDYDVLKEIFDRAKVDYETDGKAGLITLVHGGAQFKFRADMSLDDVYGAGYEEF